MVEQRHDSYVSYYMNGTFGYFLVQNTAKQLPKSKKTVVFGIHRLTTDAGTPLYLRYCIPPKRKEASDVLYRNYIKCNSFNNLGILFDSKS